MLNDSSHGVENKIKKIKTSAEKTKEKYSQWSGK